MIKCGEIYYGENLSLVISEHNNNNVTIVPMIGVEDSKKFTEERLSQFVKVKFDYRTYYVLVDQVRVINKAKLEMLKGNLDNDKTEKVREAVRKVISFN